MEVNGANLLQRESQNLSQIPLSSLAWLDCPYNNRNDPYPGQCGKYVDTDNNGFCDHSEAAPGERGIIEEMSTVAKESTVGETTAAVKPKNLQVYYTWIIFIPTALVFLYWYFTKTKRNSSQ